MINEQELLKKIIEFNTKIVEDSKDTISCIGFLYNDTFIYDPLFDETGRFPVDPVEYYGKENIEKFLKAGLERLGQ